MLRLKVASKDQWLDLPHGVRVKVRPLTTAVSEAAFAEAMERIRPLKKAAEDAEKAGVPMDASGANGANAAWLQGMQWQFLCEALARYGIAEWEGVGDDWGAPLPVEPEAIAAFAAHPDIGRAFFGAYRAALDAVDAEGNASAPSSGGAGAGALSIAEAATDAPASPEATQTASPVATVQG